MVARYTDVSSLGFIGLGSMGGPMAKNLVSAGHDLTAYDLDDDALEAIADAGATAATSTADAVEGAEVVFLSLPGPDNVDAVVEEIEADLEEGTILVDLTTSTPGTTEAIEDRLSDRDIDVLGAPVSGGSSGANAGTLSIIVGGDEAVFEACEPLFEVIGSDIFHVGDGVGHGHAVKLLNNYLSNIALLATSEAVILGDAAGLDRQTLVDVFSVSSGRNSANQDKIPNYVLTGEYDMGFKIGLMEKDMRLLSEFAGEQQVPMLLGHLTRDLAGYAKTKKGFDSDMTRVYDFLEEFMLE
ncbi:3-hydroxyisobutyrate dehydrogenase [Natronorubrum sediminis]|uniref:3-hydroxyisobutyrate dehydrogenase n=1 Tax=Natronorubrum sediminis TaxID=640943 RepID=A0A1H6G350_9EURY|nr:3-hydroxyisobutyrate dehydrogenase [Natronorubrum sediminis]